ncbi:MAG TPA: PQQ-binding-like beta-propeller repeat protein [Acidimicrobiales bacterium]
MRAIGLVALVVTQACWLQVGAGPRRTGSTGLENEITVATVADLAVAWTAAATGTSPREALVSGDAAYVRSPGSVTALRVADGAVRWSTDSLGGWAAPAIVANRLRVPVSAGQCRLVTLDLATGATVDTVGFGPPDTSVFGGASSCAPGDAVASGSTVTMPWYYLGTSPSPGCAGDHAYSVGPGVAAIDVGEPGGWSHYGTHTGCGTPPTPLPPAYGAASTDRPDRALVAVSGGVRSLGCTGTGCPAPWSVSTDGTVVGPPVILGNGDVAVAVDDGRVLVVDGASQSVEWTGQAGSALARPLAADGSSLFAVTSTGAVVAFPVDGCGAATCTPAWTATLSSPATARPSVGGGVLYVGTADGDVAAFPASGCGAPVCGPLWTAATPAAVTAPPAIADGAVVVGSSDGTITAFRLPAAGS